MPTWVRTHFEGETFVWEVADDMRVSRSVVFDARLDPVTAADLAEVVDARDMGGIDAVRAYEGRYGVAPEKPLPDWDFPHEVITQAEFEQIWEAARRALG